MFVDEVDIQVAAGDGGNGCLSFRRERFVPRGGPDGGDGGRGGSVYLEASPHENTLLKYRYHPAHRAERGAHGEGSSRTGRAGADLVLDVPPGTVVYVRRDDDLVRVADLSEAGQRVLVARGGRGGRGNERFATSTNRAPRRVEPGERGETQQLHLQLKLLADVGLVGFPNVGKSTLIARISAARPKIAGYPFTTLTPHLGVVSLSDDRSFVIADVPGLVEGAHEGHGLGHRFLSHLERTRLLVHVIDVSSATLRDPVEDYKTIQREIALYPADGAEGPAGRLATKPQLAAANKIDALDEPVRLSRLRARLEREAVRLYPISAATGEGVTALLEAIWQALAEARAAEAHAEAARARE